MLSFIIYFRKEKESSSIILKMILHCFFNEKRDKYTAWNCTWKKFQIYIFNCLPLFLLRSKINQCETAIKKQSRINDGTATKDWNGEWFITLNFKFVEVVWCTQCRFFCTIRGKWFWKFAYHFIYHLNSLDELNLLLDTNFPWFMKYICNIK